MKVIYPVLLITCATLALSACKKDNSQNGPIVGKWHEDELQLSLITSATTHRDTIYNSNAFTVDDYFQFNSDNTAKVSMSGNYTIDGKEYTPDTFNVANSVIEYKYQLSDNNLSLTPVLEHPTNGSAVYSQVIVTLSNDKLVIRTTYHNGEPSGSPLYTNPPLVTTAYYTKVK